MNIKEAFKAVGEYLTLVGNTRIVFNPEKFNFAKDKVDWAGIRITQVPQPRTLPCS